ncbi:MAG: ribulose-phosphate 3-epimerase [Phycisphaerales bacterium]|nr:ribulose-phosphate 3-epimerase [Phycisphaerales bacterium]
MTGKDQMSPGPPLTADGPGEARRALLRNPGWRVAPSLLAADFARLAEQVQAVEDAGAEMLHLDVMDGHFVPNISFGVPIIESLRSRSAMVFDAHLMIDEPDRYAESFANAGCDHITIQIEAMIGPTASPPMQRGRTLSPHQFAEAADRAAALLERLHALGVSSGVCLNPATPAESVRPVLHRVDLVLVMSVWPGFGGQAFMSEVLAKVTQLRGWLRTDQRLEIDGGIGEKTIGLAVQAGADTLVAGSAVFGAADPGQAFRELTRLAGQAAGG